MNPRFCKRCITYMLDHPTLKGWKRCGSCGWACDQDGQNLVTRQERQRQELALCERYFEKQCFKLCTSESVDCTCRQSSPNTGGQDGDQQGRDSKG